MTWDESLFLHSGLKKTDSFGYKDGLLIKINGLKLLEILVFLFLSLNHSLLKIILIELDREIVLRLETQTKR